MIQTVLHSGLLLTTPVLLAALGGAINREAGIVNIGLDGMMLVGAFFAVFVDWKTGSVLLACVAASVAGGLTGAAFALPITRLGGNMIIAGLGLSILAPGLFGYLLPVVFNQASTLQPQNIAGIPAWHIPLLSHVAFLGQTVFNQDPITYLAWVLIPGTWVLMSRTVFGLRLRAAGANPIVATSAGIRVAPVQEISTMIAGAMAGLGGAALALVSVQLFNKDMTAGRGFVALAAFYFGRNKPVLTATAAFVFGISDAVSIRLQTSGLPDQIPEMVPYVAVIVALVLVAVRTRRRERGAVANVGDLAVSGVTPTERSSL